MESQLHRPPLTRRVSRIQGAIADIVAQFDPLQKPKDVTRTMPNFEPSSYFKADTEGFDYNQFLNQLRQPGAKSVARNIRHFLNEFSRRPLTLKEQIRVIHDYLDFIVQKMAECEVWKAQSEQELENTREATEKLLMNRLCPQTFCPSTTDDDEKDKVLNQKINLFRWIKEEHLDIEANPQNDAFLSFAMAELLKMNTFKAPRDKLICVLNCCTVIFGLLKHAKGGEVGADTFLPVLIYVVIKANPPQLVSNVQYISRFRSPDKLQSEAGYYLTNLMGAITFIETMDASCLSISQDEFDKNIELTILEMNSERSTVEHGKSPSLARDHVVQRQGSISSKNTASRPSSGSSQPMTSTMLEPVAGPAEKAAMFLERFAQRTIEKPLNFVGKILSDLTTPDTSDDEGQLSISSKALPPAPSRQNEPTLSGGIRSASPRTTESQEETPMVAHHDIQGEMFPGEHVYRRMSVQELESNLSLLQDMFPNVESDVCRIILQANQGYIPATIEALLDISKSSPTDATNESFGSFSSIPETVVEDTTQGNQDVPVLSDQFQTGPGLLVPASTVLLHSEHGRHPSVGSVTSEKVLREAGEASSDDISSPVPAGQQPRGIRNTANKEDLAGSMADLSVDDVTDDQLSLKPKHDHSPKP
ncbi:hypothetical protein IWQ61_006166 [Dispira simplex]|nr:hypothetical protein IWQ61_006166 [Dispira simplex]